MKHTADCTCSDCRVERRLLGVIRFDGTAPQGPLDDLSQRRLVDQVLRRAKDEGPCVVEPGSSSSQFPVRGFVRPALMAAAALLLVAAGTWFVRGLTQEVEGPGRQEALAQAVAAPPGERSKWRELELDGGQTSLLLDEESRVLLHGDARARVGEDDGGHVVALLRGSLLVSVTPNRGERLAVESPHGRIEVRGTVFEVVVQDERTSVAVLRGQVSVSDALGTRPLDAGHVAVLDRKDIELLEPEALFGLVDRFRRLDPDRAAELYDQGDSGRDVEILGVRTPHQAKGGAPAGKRSRAQELLAEAQGARAARRFFDAASLYRELIDRYPRADEAAAGMVSLGELQLEKLGQPRDAQRSFERYLARSGNGPLAPEALLGKARALRAMGRVAEEVAVLEELVRRFPASGPARAAARRLEEQRRQQ